MLKFDVFHWTNRRILLTFDEFGYCGCCLFIYMSLSGKHIWAKQTNFLHGHNQFDVINFWKGISLPFLVWRKHFTMSIGKNIQASDDTGNYQIRPSLSDSFKVAAVKDIIIKVMHETLEGERIISIQYFKFSHSLRVCPPPSSPQERRIQKRTQPFGRGKSRTMSINEWKNSIFPDTSMSHKSCWLNNQEQDADISHDAVGMLKVIAKSPRFTMPNACTALRRFSAYLIIENEFWRVLTTELSLYSYIIFISSNHCLIYKI